METKHTPGEWKRLLPPLNHVISSFEEHDKSKNGKAVCYIHAGTEYSEANARLIAAAPELLEALKEVIAISDRKHDAWDKAKAAIKKATS